MQFLVCVKLEFPPDSHVLLVEAHGRLAELLSELLKSIVKIGFDAVIVRLSFVEINGGFNLFARGEERQNRVAASDPRPKRSTAEAKGQGKSKSGFTSSW